MPNPLKKIIAIGGGDIGKAGMGAIDKRIIQLTQKTRPKLLFIPTASSDDSSYWKNIEQYFGKKLGCRTEALLLLSEKPTQRVIRQKILSADIIYVGGGNTLKMMNVWRRRGVDKLLRKAWKKGIVLCGMSAGSICWFESGHSDSMSFYNPKKWKYIKVQGLGLLKGIHCPHYNSKTLGVLRRNNFNKMIQNTGGIGIAIEDNCAIEFIDDNYRVITSNKNAKAYKVFSMNGRVVTTVISQTEEFTPIATLY